MKAFNISNDTIVVTSKYVTEKGFAITEVTHEDDEEGGSLWQFHCGNGDYSMDQMQLVRLDTILALDPSVADVADLMMNFTATRTAKGLPWKLVPITHGDNGNRGSVHKKDEN